MTTLAPISTASTTSFASVSCERLSHALSLVMSAVAAKTTLPVLANVLLSVTQQDGAAIMTLTGSNLDLTIKTRLAVDSGDLNAITVPAKKLAEVLSTMPAGIVTLSLRGTKLTVASGKAKVTLMGLPSEDFPMTNSVTSAAVLFGTLPALTLHMMGAQVSFAASTEESRPILNGVLFEKKGSRLRTVATNGHKLALAGTTLGADTLGAGDRDLILTVDFLNAARRAISGDDTVQISTSENHIIVANDATEVIGRLIEGPFPNYAQVLPKDNDKTATGDRGAFSAAIKRVATMASDQTHRIKLSFSADTGCAVTAQTTDVGEASDETPMTYTGDAIEIGVNAAYLAELLKAMPCEQMALTMRAPERAMTLTPVTLPANLTELLMLVMPLRLIDA